MTRTRPRLVLRVVVSIVLGCVTLVLLAGEASAATGVGTNDSASTPADEDLAINVLANDAGAPSDATLSVSGSSQNGAYIWVDDARLVHYQAFTVTVSKAKVVSARDDDLRAEKDTANELSVLDNDTPATACSP